MHPRPCRTRQVSSRQGLGRDSATAGEPNFVVNRREATPSSAESLYRQADNERNPSSLWAARTAPSSFGFSPLLPLTTLALLAKPALPKASGDRTGHAYDR